MDKVHEYDIAIKDSEIASGISWSHVEIQLGGVRDRVQEVYDKVDTVIKQTNQLDNFRNAVNNIGTAWGKVNSKIGEAINKLNSFLTMLRTASQVEVPGLSTALNPLADSLKDWLLDLDKSNSSNGNNPNTTTTKTNQYSLVADPFGVYNTYAVMDEKSGQYLEISGSLSELQEKYGILPYASFYNSFGVSATPSSNGKSNQTITRDKDIPTGNIISELSNGSVINYQEELIRRAKMGDFYAMDELNRLGIPFATGGYTGDWSDGSGKIGILHSKELVLNKEDTKNILDTVNIVRSISSNISKGLAGLMSSLFGLGSNPNISNSTSTSSNNTFNITAEFPNASNVEDIQEAILSLPNLASQYLSANP